MNPEPFTFIDLLRTVNFPNDFINYIKGTPQKTKSNKGNS